MSRYSHQAGLTSPAFERLGSRWALAATKPSTTDEDHFPPSLPDTPFEVSSSISSSPGKSGSILDESTGLPSPPATNSDIALPNPYHDSLLVESPPATLDSTLRFGPSRRNTSSSSRPQSMTSSTSSRNLTKALKPDDSGMSRSTSSSSSLATPLRPKGGLIDSKGSRRQSTDLSRGLSSSQSSHTSHRSISSLRPKSSARRESLDLTRKESLSSSRSSHQSRQYTSSLRPRDTDVIEDVQGYPLDDAAQQHLSSSQTSSRSTASRQEDNTGTINARRLPNDLTRQYSRTSSQGSASSPHILPSPKRQPSYTGSTSSSRHRSSPSASLPEPSKRTSGIFTASPVSSPVVDKPSSRLLRPERNERNERNGRSGQEEDERIRLAEEQIRSATARRTRPSEAYPSISPPKPVLYSRDSYTRAGGTGVAHQIQNGTETLRRSATISSVSSLARTPNGDVHALEDAQDRSGGSGGSKRRPPLPASFTHANQSLFTPSPKPTPSGQRPPLHAESPTTSLSRYNTTSRLARDGSVPSPSSPRARRSGIDGLERSASVSSRLEKRQWSESVSGLPRRHDRLDDRGLPLPGSPLRDRRAETLAGSEYGSQRYSRDQDLVPRLSRLHIAPGDSVSAVGARSERDTPVSNKDPLDLLRRIENERAESNRNWDAERSASAMGDHPYPRPHSGSHIDRSPRSVRPATSMSSLHHHPPRTAPVDRIRRNYDDSSSFRSTSRLGNNAPSSEPRQFRSTTSLGGRSSTSLDIHAASSEHGRLLYEAARAVDAKIGQSEAIAQFGLIQSLNASARSAETSNSAIRIALQTANQIAIDDELDHDSNHISDTLKPLLALLRDASRTSDENVRMLTRVLLDLPKVLREGTGGSRMMPSSTTSGSVRSFALTDSSDHRGSRRFPASPYETPVRNGGEEFVRPATSYDNFRSSEPRRHRDSLPKVEEYEQSYSRNHKPSPVHLYDSPVRRSEDLPRPSTSIDHVSSNERRRTRESLPPNFTSGETGRGGPWSKVRGVGKSKDNLGTIEDSPPQVSSHKIPESPRSPARRLLRHKASSTSTHTIRGGNNFLPSAPKTANTVMSAVTAGDDDSPTTAVFDQRSIRSMRSYRETREDGVEGSSPRSKMSFHTAEEVVSRTGSSRDGEGAEDDVLSGLVEAQRRREAESWGKGDTVKKGEMAGLGRSSSMTSRTSRTMSFSEKVKAKLGR